MYMKFTVYFLLATFGILSLQSFGQTSKNKSKTVDERVNDLLKQMSIDDKVGQMTLADFGPLKENLSDIVTYKLGNVMFGGDSDPDLNSSGSWALTTDSLQQFALSSNLHIPLLIGTDFPHGHSNLSNTEIFPHNIGMACTRNMRLVSEQAQISATEAAATGVRWTFAPFMAVSTDIRWGRTYECYGEDPLVAKQMIDAYVTGTKKTVLPGGGSVLSCPKYLGFNGLKNATKKSPADIALQMKSVIQIDGDTAILNAGSIIVSLHSLNGDTSQGKQFALVESLKNKLGYKGFVVSDWGSTMDISGDYYNVVKNSVNAGVDMFMEASSYKHFIETLKLCVAKGDVSIERINDAVRRILTQKIKIGLFEHPLSYQELMEKVGSVGHRNIARECVKESIVLLQNKNNVLPLSKKANRIHIAGSAANDMAAQCGGWTIGWQGIADRQVEGSTFLDAIKHAGAESKITYSKNGQSAAGSDVGIVVISEDPYADWFGDNSELFLKQEDINAVMNIKNANVPVVCIVLSGRPVILDPILNYCDAIVAAWLPGTEMNGLTDVLFGNNKPQGKLAVTWPVSMDQVPIIHQDSVYNPLFAYGAGITDYEPVPKNALPRLLSATLSKRGTAVELAFTKPIADGSKIEDFIVTIGDKSYKLSSIEIKKDVSSLILYLKDTLKTSQKMYLNYFGQSVKSKDGGEVLPVKNFVIFNPQSTVKRLFKIPAMIQAEKYTDQKDIDIQDCWDDKGGQDIVLEDEEWAEYILTSNFPGLYNVIFRVNAAEKSTMQLLVDGQLVGIVKVPKTKTKWKSIEIKGVKINEGKQAFTVKVKGNKVALNWISFDTFVTFQSKTSK